MQSYYSDDGIEDEDESRRQNTSRRVLVPTLEALATRALAENIHRMEPLALQQLPYGGGTKIIRQLLRSGHLRPETLQPLLADWSSAPDLEDEIGGHLLAGAASGCRGLSALAVQRLRFQQQQQQQRRRQTHQPERALPNGTRQRDTLYSESR